MRLCIALAFVVAGLLGLECAQAAPPVQKKAVSAAAAEEGEEEAPAADAPAKAPASKAVSQEGKPLSPKIEAWFRKHRASKDDPEKRFPALRNVRWWKRDAASGGWQDLALSAKSWNEIGYLVLVQGEPLAGVAKPAGADLLQDAEIAIQLEDGAEMPVIWRLGGTEEEPKPLARKARRRPDNSEPETLYRWLVRELGYQGVVVARSGEYAVVATCRCFLGDKVQGLFLNGSAKQDLVADSSVAASDLFEVVRMEDEYALMRRVLGTKPAVPGTKVLFNDVLDVVKFSTPELPYAGYQGVGILGGVEASSSSLRLPYIEPYSQSKNGIVGAELRLNLGIPSPLSVLPQYAVGKHILTLGLSASSSLFSAYSRFPLNAGGMVGYVMPLRNSSSWNFGLGGVAELRSIVESVVEEPIETAVDFSATIQRFLFLGPRVVFGRASENWTLEVGYVPSYIRRTSSSTLQLGTERWKWKGLAHAIDAHATWKFGVAAIPLALVLRASGVRFAMKTPPFSLKQWNAMGGLGFRF